MGLPLLDWIFTREETTEAMCAVLVKQVIQALQYLHSAHVAYLDLKVQRSKGNEIWGDCRLVYEAVWKWKELIWLWAMKWLLGLMKCPFVDDRVVLEMLRNWAFLFTFQPEH